jgi:predicted NBD/HSP70 family sugar kinase
MPPTARHRKAPKVLTIDIGGTNVKMLATGQHPPRKFPSGKTLTPANLIEGVKQLAHGWAYDVVSIGFPARIVEGAPTAEPRNLAPGWLGFDFSAAFGCPVKIVNDAAMQALGSYKGGTMLFLGLGTGLGSALVVNGTLVPMELGHLSYKKGTLEDYLGLRGIQRLGKKKWRRYVEVVVKRFTDALLLDDFVLGGGNAKKLRAVPPGCRIGSNDLAFVGGVRLWSDAAGRSAPRRTRGA